MTIFVVMATEPYSEDNDHVAVKAFYKWEDAWDYLRDKELTGYIEEVELG